MPNAELERVVVKEFSPEQAGELVGWVNVVQIEESDVISAAVAYARLSAAGARYTYLTRGERKLLERGESMRGFEDSTELTVTGKEDGTVINVLPSKSPGQEFYRRTQHGGDQGFADTFYKHQGSPVDGDGEWAVGSAEILQTIKGQLKENDAETLYSAVYYNLAQMTQPGMLLADPSMHPGTSLIEIPNIKDYIQRLERIKSADEAMQRNLTVFGSVKPKNVPDRFRDSRRRVHELEVAAAVYQDATVSGPWLKRLSDTLTWPYMDPLLDDERIAFGRQFDALKNRDIEPATYALKRELEAAESRFKTAGEVAVKLALLANREAQPPDLSSEH